MISGRVENMNVQAIGDTPAQQTAEPIQMSPPEIQAKSSAAIPIWSAIIGIVLMALWFQTSMGTANQSYNFLIEGSPECEGAAVIVDGKPVGTMSASNDAGVKMVGLRLHLNDGFHNIEVQQPGYLPQSRQVLLKGEEYVGVELQRSSK